MNAPLDNEAHRRGGRDRDKGRPEWEAQFMGVLAGSSRPLKKDHAAASDPKEAVEILNRETKRFPWVILSVVGRDGRSVSLRSAHSGAGAEARIHQMGGAIGLSGLILLRDRLLTYTRPFIAGLEVEETLTDAMEKLKPIAFQILQDELPKKETK
jgi:hypothetical protein